MCILRIINNFFLFKTIKVSAEELSTDSCPAEIWCSQNSYLSEKKIFEGKHASFKNIKFPRGNYRTR